MLEMCEILAAAERAYLIAPAGCGKTEVIADAVALSTGRQLILTHTHAGVDSLRYRLRRKGVPGSRFHVDTIASWALRYSQSYPLLSGLSEDPMLIAGKDWARVYECADTLLASRTAQEVVRGSYSGLFVDEYQDCGVRHHAIVMRLAALLPCRLLGDPLQGIFDFDGDLIDWDEDVHQHFERLPDLTVPWRWSASGGGNEALGEWLLEVREILIGGGNIDLRGAPAGVTWKQHIPANYMDIPNHCRKQARLRGSIIIIHRFPNLCHRLAKQLSGQYQSMDEMAAKDLMGHAAALDASRGGEAALLMDFAAECMIGVATELKPLRDRYRAGNMATPGQRAKHPGVTNALDEVSRTPTPQAMTATLDAIKRECIDCKMCRQEMWSEMLRALANKAETLMTLKECAWTVRNRTRIIGRQLPRRTVSRTLLVKGLEFDHVTVLDAHELNSKNLYVALTRAKSTLTIWSPSPILQPGSR
jgi:hypothetical protein